MGGGRYDIARCEEGEVILLVNVRGGRRRGEGKEGE